MPLILFFIFMLNIVAIILTYYCLSNLENKEKVIFIAVGVAVVYMLTSFVYWISTKDIAVKEVSELGKKLLTFLFVPINGIITLPILAKSYNKYKIGRLESDKLRNRGILILIVLAIALMLECSYFKDVQNRVVTLIEQNNGKKNDVIQTAPDMGTNTLANDVTNEEISNVVSENNTEMINNGNTNKNSNMIENIVNQMN